LICRRDADSTLTFADMGCGKGYLTFGAWHLFRRVWKQTVRVIGVEARPELVANTNRLARQIRADGLEFISGDIASATLPRVDALIALHACNTATDDAIRRGIELGAKLIIVAPCCHKELRPQLGRPEPLGPLLRHGVMEERLAEWLTDGLRALFLEWAGYRTKVMEFIAGEHTPKNLMLVAIREREPFTDAAAGKRIEDLKAWFGIQHHALDGLLTGGGSETVRKAD
jgi:SAM-dependent methyltransferase